MRQQILITGGGTGIGRALAERMASHDWHVIVVGRRPEPLAELVEQWPGKIQAVVADVGNPDDRLRIDEALKGPLQALVHNAAVLSPVGSVLNLQPEDWREHMAINLEGPWFLTKQLLPKLQEGSRILNVSSGAAHRPIYGWGAYCLSKASLYMLSQLLQEELAARQIWVGSVRPGVVDTPMQAEIRGLSPENFPMVEQFRQYKATGALEPVERVAQFLHWLLVDVAGPQLGQREWDIRETEWRAAWEKLA